ncbi:MAG: type I-F CRISPR-associated protein Csy2 [Candidatus Sericytochromatia bacterium]
MKTAVLLLPHLHIQNANALSSPYTIGFPALTAWLGGCHALQRQLNQQGFPQLRFQGVGICCHDIDLQTHKGQGDFVASIVGTGNPLDKTGARAPFVEEARCHLKVSLVIEYTGYSLADADKLIETLKRLLRSRLKWAGGDVLSVGEPEHLPVHDETDLRHLKRRLMPGYVILERRQILEEAMATEKDALDALLSCLQVTHRSELDENGQVNWSSKRKFSGWLVPLATGFQGISPLGKADHQRDPDTPHRFAESVVTLGEFVMPHHIKTLADMLWYYHVDLDKNLYLCQQNQPVQESTHD